VEENLEEIEFLYTWVKNPLSIRGREPEDFLPKFIHPKDLDLTFLSKVNLSNATPDLALVQKNKVLEERNKQLEQELQAQKLKLIKFEAEMREARIREEQYKSKTDRKLAETQVILKKILENQNKSNP
jgi:hypothetical protein